MNRIVTLMLALCLVFGAVANSAAADIKAKGTMWMEYAWIDNTNFGDSDADGDSEDDFVAQQRFRTQIDIVANENLSGVVYFEIDHAWGRSDATGKVTGGSLGADGVNIETKRAYLDWTVPNTALSVRMGIQGIALPSAALGTPVLTDDVAAVVGTYKFNDMFTLTGFWARPFDRGQVDDGKNEYDEVDLFGVIGGVKLDGMDITPWAMYGSIGKDAPVSGKSATGLTSLYGQNLPAADSKLVYVNRPATSGISTIFNSTESQESSDAYWLGLAFSVNMFDPIVFSMDAVYGNVDSGDFRYQTHYGNATTGAFNASQGTTSDDDVLDRAGWMVSAKLSYKMDMVTPGIIGWYGSGEDDDIMNGSERLPSLRGGFAPTSFGYYGYAGGNLTETGEIMGSTADGRWALGLVLEDIKVIDDLTSQFRVVYMKGTNDHEVLDSMEQYTGRTRQNFLAANAGKFLTDKDHAWEVNFDHKYNIYENLAMVVELGYINLDLDDDVWEMGDNEFDDDAWKANVIFQYTF